MEPLAAFNWRSLRSCAAAALSFASACFLVPPSFSQDRELVQAIEAAYIYRLAPFVNWPSTSFAAENSPFTVCVVGDDRFGSLVRRAVADQTVRGRGFLVHSVPSLEAGASCHIAYLSPHGAQAPGDALAAMGDAAVLTITDGTSGGQPLGIVHFVFHEGRVRFEIDDLRADQVGLSISSKILALAVRVRPRT